jgi:hypothetical protein
MNSTIKTVRIQPNPAQVVVKSATALSATCLDAAGRTVLVPTGSISWSISSGADVAMVDPVTGVVTGITVAADHTSETATVRATERESGVFGTADIQVKPGKGSIIVPIG